MGELAPDQAPICATSFTGASRSSRAISESWSVAGIARRGSGPRARSRPPSPGAGPTRARPWSAPRRTAAPRRSWRRSASSTPSAGLARRRQPLDDRLPRLRRPSRLRVSAVTCAWPGQGGLNSGRKVTTSSTGRRSHAARPRGRTAPAWSDRTSARPRAPPAPGSAPRGPRAGRAAPRRCAAFFCLRRQVRAASSGRRPASPSSSAKQGAAAATSGSTACASSASSLASFASAVVVAGEARRPLELLDHRVERAVRRGRASIGSAGRCAARRAAARAARARGATCRCPARPTSSTTWPSPARARRQRSSSSASSCSRPTSGSGAPRAAQRLEAALARPSPDHAPGAHRLGEALEPAGPRSAKSNRSPSEPARASATTTVPGSASACSRAARFGVSPTTASSCGRALARRGRPRRRARWRSRPGPQARSPPACRKPAHRRDDGEPGPDRPLGVVLVRLGQPK